MITIENCTIVRMDGRRVGCIPAEKWQIALLALGATGGFRREGNWYTATPIKRCRPNLVRTLKRIVI
jgi:hypothetical protein